MSLRECKILHGDPMNVDGRGLGKIYYDNSKFFCIETSNGNSYKPL